MKVFTVEMKMPEFGWTNDLAWDINADSPSEAIEKVKTQMQFACTGSYEVPEVTV